MLVQSYDMFPIGVVVDSTAPEGEGDERGRPGDEQRHRSLPCGGLPHAPLPG